MKLSLVVLACVLFFSLNANANTNDNRVEDLCWMDNQNEEICLSDSPNTVHVLIFNAGWCGPCNSHMSDLSRRVKNKYDGKNVRFISLSIHGWNRPSTPNAKFLNEWKETHNIPFEVAASKISQLYEFFPSGYIPADMILDQNNNIAYRNNSGASVTSLFNEVDRLLTVER